MKVLVHPNLLNLIEIFEDEEFYYLIFDFPGEGFKTVDEYCYSNENTRYFKKVIMSEN
jgi:hypothetical protein